MSGIVGVTAQEGYSLNMYAYSDRDATSNGMSNVASLPAQLETTAGLQTTTGMLSSGYESSLPRNLSIFSEVEHGIDSPSLDEGQRFLAHDLITAIKASLLLNYRERYMNLPYSELHMSVLDDNSALIEWTYLNFRAGFSIEQDVSKSSYYVLVRDETDGNSTVIPEFGQLSKDNVDAVAAKVVSLISERL